MQEELFCSPGPVKAFDETERLGGAHSQTPMACLTYSKDEDSAHTAAGNLGNQSKKKCTTIGH